MQVVKPSILQKFFIFCEGRHTTFAIVELAIGTALAWFHRLDMSFVALVGTIQAFVLGHSVKEDYFAAKDNETGGSDVTPTV